LLEEIDVCDDLATTANGRSATAVISGSLVSHKEALQSLRIDKQVHFAESFARVFLDH
jgi:hypothetical protein